MKFVLTNKSCTKQKIKPGEQDIVNTDKLLDVPATPNIEIENITPRFVLHDISPFTILFDLDNKIQATNGIKNKELRCFTHRFSPDTALVTIFGLILL